jgi:hypothetical protein
VGRGNQVRSCARRLPGTAHGGQRAVRVAEPVPEDVARPHHLVAGPAETSPHAPLHGRRTRLFAGSPP